MSHPYRRVVREVKPAPKHHKHPPNPGNPHSQEFTGRKRLVIVWVKRLTLDDSSWEPVACLTRKEASAELREARKAGYQAFSTTYLKARRNEGDRRAERDAEDEE